MLRQEAAKRRNIDRQNKLLADSDRIVQLANELNTAVDPKGKDPASVAMAKKAEEIEKLARQRKRPDEVGLASLSRSRRQRRSSHLSALMKVARFLGLRSLGGNRVRNLQEHHSQVEERGLQELLLAVGNVALGFFGQYGQQIDRLACADDVDARFLAGLGGGAHGDHCREIKRLHDLFEICRGIGGRTGVSLADHVVQLYGGLLVRGVLLGRLLAGRNWAKLLFDRLVGQVVFGTGGLVWLGNYCIDGIAGGRGGRVSTGRWWQGCREVLRH